MSLSALAARRSAVALRLRGTGAAPRRRRRRMPIRSIRRRPARSIRSRCRRSPIRMRRRRRPRNCSARKTDAVARPGALDRLLCRRLPGRRRGAADHRADLAGDAAVAQPQLGQSGAHRVPRALWRQRQEGRLERASGRRHVAAARRPDDHRPRQPSDRPRCRYLVHADARSRADARGARVRRRRQHGGAGSARRRSQGLDAMPAPSSSAPRRRIRR